MQSMSWRCVFSPALSMRRSAAVTRPEAEAALAEAAAADLGSAARPSNNRTSSRSMRRIVSRMQRSSP